MARVYIVKASQNYRRVGNRFPQPLLEDLQFIVKAPDIQPAREAFLGKNCLRDRKVIRPDQNARAEILLAEYLLVDDGNPTEQWQLAQEMHDPVTYRTGSDQKDVYHQLQRNTRARVSVFAV